jgi:hypothetical protein
MNLVPGEHILVADAPEAFAEAVVSLHEDASLWERLAANGPSGVAAQWSTGVARDAIKRVLEAGGAARRP